MLHLTLADVLNLPVVRQGAPVVLAGEVNLHAAVRWVHATELVDIAPLLRAGDLVLTTGVGLPADGDRAGLQGFIDSLAEAGCAGLMVEYGRRWQEGTLPPVLVGACDEAGLPLVAFTHEVRFAAVIQTVGETVVDQQLAQLREAERVHETFTELSFEQAEAQQVLEAVRRLAGAPVVLENDQHRPLDFLPGPVVVPDFLDGWRARSARVSVSGRTSWDEANGWLVTRLGSREQTWGRLIIGSEQPPSQRLIAVAERAAASLALHRLRDRDQENASRRRHHELLLALTSQPVDDDLVRRCELAGFPIARRQFAGVVLRPAALGGGRDNLDEVIAAVVAAAHAVKVPALVAQVDREVRLLLSIPASAQADPLVDRLAARLRQAMVAGAGRAVMVPEAIDRTMAEARHVADSVPPVAPGGGPSGQAVTVHRLPDVHLHGLLTLLGEDERVRLFVDRELEPLRRHDSSPAGKQIQLLPVLRALLEHPASKSEAAAGLHLSRAAFYDRLSKLERVLGVDLDNPSIRVSLHVALIADDLAQARAR
ncbi:CdaR family transcriptional regulator [Kineosporia sp. NBRC 101677]|uniref:PucR family transcriptional regulator n=1 Tax=Kineosporia sp. NBRC 101677 TaxID=3032197 RepID=UPI0024A5CD37|nr:PucR family transcriptional regulator ligand-binding domain-containing protein [Kineosporia sp. NBRC 101677]GLY16366.1 CdaR family transcriptional regulator [Kineosporia sp. NBRC 101677]